MTIPRRSHWALLVRTIAWVFIGFSFLWFRVLTLSGRYYITDALCNAGRVGYNKGTEKGTNRGDIHTEETVWSERPPSATGCGDGARRLT
jgi:hypothetical protein